MCGGEGEVEVNLEHKGVCGGEEEKEEKMDGGVSCCAASAFQPPSVLH